MNKKIENNTAEKGKITNYAVRKARVLRALKNSSSPRELEINLVLSTEHDSSECLDCLTRYLLGITFNFPRETAKEIINDLLLYFLSDKVYYQKLAGHTPEQQLSFIVRRYKWRVMDKAQKGSKSVTGDSDEGKDKKENPTKPEAKKQKEKKAVKTKPVTVSFDALQDNLRDLVYAFVTDDRYSLDAVEEKVFETEECYAALSVIGNILSVRELLCFILAEYFNFPPRIGGVFVKGRTYAEVFSFICSYNPEAFSAIEHRIDFDSDKGFNSKDCIRAYTVAVNNARTTLRELSLKRENIFDTYNGCVA